MGNGWFSVKRGITNHPLFKRQPERLAIWLWLIDNAAWLDTKQDIKGKIVTVLRGSISASERRIAEEIGVGYQVVRTALKLFKTEQMISHTVTQGRTMVNLCNYDKYQTQPEPPNAEPTQGNLKLNAETNADRNIASLCNYDKSQTHTEPPNAPPNAEITLGQRTKEQKKDSYTVLFLKFWAAFPSGRKMGKKKCIATFNAAVKSGVDADHIIQAAEQYAALMARKQTEQRFIKNSTTWLNQGCWDDELETGRDDGALDNQGIRKVENGMGDSERGADRGEAPPRNAEDDLPGMLGAPEEENRSVPVGDVQAGRDRLEMLALSDGGGIVF